MTTLGFSLVASLFSACLFPKEREIPCADQARLESPVDLAAYARRGTLWPHGAHGMVHPEGHPGIDLVLDTAGPMDIAVLAPISGEIVATTEEEDFPGSSCLILDSACIQVNLCHLRLSPGLREGSQIKRGQRLGTVVATESAGPSVYRYALHFGTYIKSGDSQVCPADFLDPDLVRCALGRETGETSPSGCSLAFPGTPMLSRSDFIEAHERNLELACGDGSRRTFLLPAENKICNARLPDSLRAEIEACMGPGCAGVW